MSLYRHVENKEAVLDGIVGLIIREIDVPADPECAWDEAIRRVARSYRQAALAHPHAFPLLTTRPLITVEAARRVDAFFDLGRRAGFDEHTTLVTYRMLSAYVRGFALEEVTGRAFRAEAVSSPPEGLASEFPRIAELSPLLSKPDPDAEFERGLEVIVTGLRAGLTGAKRRARAAKVPPVSSARAAARRQAPRSNARPWPR